MPADDTTHEPGALGRLLGRGKAAVVELAQRRGYRIERLDRPREVPIDLGPELDALYRAVEPYTLTGPERIAALRDAVRHVVAAGVPGALVECGVWRGGSMLAAARTLLDAGVDDRDLHLFDTFTEMPPPDDVDGDILGRSGKDLLAVTSTLPEFDIWPAARVVEVIRSSGYPADRIHPVPGLVEDTVPGAAPEEIALLRLDTDWYASTKHELEHLVPRLTPGGICIIDDYGEFVGARQAVDEYLAALGVPVLLHRIDTTGRLFVASEPLLAAARRHLDALPAAG
ncbi:MAG: TylF/MycF/NovP-related O-methyltransferase [Actinomycetota bacterium]